MAAPEGSGDRPAGLGSYVVNLANAVHKGISRLVTPYGLTYADLRLMMICRQKKGMHRIAAGPNAAAGRNPDQPSGERPCEPGSAEPSSAAPRPSGRYARPDPRRAGADGPGDRSAPARLREARRRSRPGGVLGICGHGAADNRQLRRNVSAGSTPARARPG